MRVDEPKANAIVSAHASLGVNELGKFPAPDKATVFAAEIVKMMLEATAYKGTFAVSISHVYNVGSNQSNFVVAFSGHHPDLHPNRKDTTRLLNNDLKEANHPLADRVRVSYTHHLDVSYHPMHITTQGVFNAIFKKFADIPATDVDGCLNEFRAKIKWDTIYESATNTIKVGAKPQFSQLGKNLLLGVGAAGLALRMGIVKPGDESAVVKFLRGFIRQLKLLKDVPNEGPNFTQLAQLLEKLLLSQKATDIEKQASLVLEDVTYANALVEGTRSRLVEAWGANALGRFCAEPKGLFFARNAGLIPDEPILGIKPGDTQYTSTQNGALQGQLAFWHSFTERREFNAKLFVYGSSATDKAPGHGAYMKPCSSRAAQSTGMMTSLLAPVALPSADLANFNWMLAGERQLIDEINRLFPRKLDFTAAQVLANTIIDKRRTLAAPPANPQDYFVKIAKDRAVRMALAL
ncbi:MAG: hypothetical protein WBE76_04760 [Terracidiphilus sp.]